VWDEATLLPTSMVSPTLLLGTITFEKLQTERTVSIQVFNPGDECSNFEVPGALSNRVTFTITP
jgi:hypothetical protein